MDETVAQLPVCLFQFVLFSLISSTNAIYLLNTRCVIIFSPRIIWWIRTDEWWIKRLWSWFCFESTIGNYASSAVLSTASFLLRGERPVSWHQPLLVRCTPTPPSMGKSPLEQVLSRAIASVVVWLRFAWCKIEIWALRVNWIGSRTHTTLLHIGSSLGASSLTFQRAEISDKQTRKRPYGRSEGLGLPAIPVEVESPQNLTAKHPYGEWHFLHDQVQVVTTSGEKGHGSVVDAMGVPNALCLCCPVACRRGGGATAFVCLPPPSGLQPPLQKVCRGVGLGGVREDVMRTRPEQGIFSWVCSAAVEGTLGRHTAPSKATV